MKGSDEGPSIDHIHPRSKGGPDDLWNLQLTHWGCNREKSATLIADAPPAHLLAKRDRQRPVRDVNCARCSIKFTTTIATKAYCSERCNEAARKQRRRERAA